MKKALILIDIQNDYFSGGRFELNNPDKTALNAKNVLAYFRKKDLPIFHVQHVNLRADVPFFTAATEGVKIYPQVAPLPGETLIIKHTPDSFFNTDLLPLLNEMEIKELVIFKWMINFVKRANRSNHALFESVFHTL